jgi:hypothetical protein
VCVPARVRVRVRRSKEFEFIHTGVRGHTMPGLKGVYERLRLQLPDLQRSSGPKKSDVPMRSMPPNPALLVSTRDV